MLNLLRHPPKTDRRAIHRAVALIVLALQVVFAAAPAWEERAGVSLGAHAEEQGSPQHAEQHSEQSCVVCAARTQSQAPASPMPDIAFESADPAPFARAEYVASDFRAVSTQSRAPPTVPN
jgi:hypothetical protein